MLAAEFALAVAPAAVRHHRGDARIGAAGIDADRAAEARADDADAVRIDRRMLGQKLQRLGSYVRVDLAPQRNQILVQKRRIGGCRVICAISRAARST